MYIIDRFEGDFAVVEGTDRKIFNLPKKLVPEAKTGDVIIIEVSIDDQATARRKKNAQALLDNFFDE